jgi:surface protein
MIKRILLLSTLFFVVNFLQAQMSLEFNTNLSSGTTITLLLYGTVDVNVDWGDEITQAFTSEGDYSHTYTSHGIYTVTINGTLTHFKGCSNSSAVKLVKINDFGEVGLTDLSYSCYHAINLIEVPNHIPAEVTNLSYMFGDATAFNLDISSWDVSNVNDMSMMFRYAQSFNQNIGNWDVSNVTDMNGMFYSASAFNQNIGGWNVSNVADMSKMFDHAVAFNQNIGSWDVSSVLDMNYMFYHADSFNQNIGDWDVSSVENMSSMFRYAILFNQDIGNWNVSNVTDMEFMYKSANSFNQNIDNLDVSSVIDMKWMFCGATMFNQNIGSWDVSGVLDLALFLSYATEFNQNIGSWDVSSVTNMAGVFAGASAFNQDIGSWDVTNVNDMSSMFFYASSFDQDIGNWNVSNVTDMSYMFDDVTLSVANYNSLLIGWAAQNLTPDVIFSGGNSKYSCEAMDAHDILTGNPNNWIISDGGLLDDDIVPTISCPSNLTIIADDISQTYTVQGTELDPLEFTDNCSVSSVINDFSNTESLNGSAFDIGTTTVVWTVEDEAGNQSTCSLDVTVETFVGIENNISSFSIYPNPTSALLTIEANNLQNYNTIIVSDALGRVVYETKIDDSTITIDLSNQNQGMYFIEIRGNQNSVFEKIVVE